MHGTTNLPGYTLGSGAVTRSSAALGDFALMYTAWLKPCLLQVTLWSPPYVKDGDF